MCGRFTLTTPAELIAEVFGLEQTPQLSARYNIAPTQDVAAVVPAGGKRQLELFRWGMLAPAEADREDALMINARSETAATKPLFRESFRSRRCLVPADGFYEWRKDKSDKRPWRIVDAERPAFAFAGVWEGWRNPAGEIVRSFAIVTTDANEKLAPIHDRMPVMLKRDDEDAWLDPNTPEPKLLPLLAPYDAAKTALYRVDARVNSVKNDDPECHAKVEQ